MGSDADRRERNVTATEMREYDAVIVGASLAGCAAATLLARDGARVALVEKQPDPRAFKKICTHFIQASAKPTLRRLDLLDPILEAGAVSYVGRLRTRWGWMEPPPDRAEPSLTLRRMVLDPIVRDAAAATPGVELLLGRTAVAVQRDGDAFGGVTVRDRDGEETTLRGRLVVAADGRDSRLAALAGLEGKTLPHGRICYAAYYEGPMPEGAPNTSAWNTDPQFALAAPTDGGLILYGVMPTKDRLPEFKRDPEEAMVSMIASMPDPPPIREAKRVAPVSGKLEMPNRLRGPVAPGLALIGDAALASDPLFGIGCGWAFQSAEWLADAVAPALRGEEPLQRGLRRYRRRHRSELRGHCLLIHSYATGRRFNLAERTLYSAAARDDGVAEAVDVLYTRRRKPGRVLVRALPRAVAVNARHNFPRTGRGELRPDRGAASAPRSPRGSPPSG